MITIGKATMQMYCSDNPNSSTAALQYHSVSCLSLPNHKHVSIFSCSMTALCYRFHLCLELSTMVCTLLPKLYTVPGGQASGWVAPTWHTSLETWHLKASTRTYELTAKEKARPIMWFWTQMAGEASCIGAIWSSSAQACCSLLESRSTSQEDLPPHLTPAAGLTQTQSALEVA